VPALSLAPGDDHLFFSNAFFLRLGVFYSLDFFFNLGFVDDARLNRCFLHVLVAANFEGIGDIETEKQQAN